MKMRLYSTAEIVRFHGDPMWEAIWSAIQGWEIKRDGENGYASATGDDATHIFEQVLRRRRD